MKTISICNDIAIAADLQSEYAQKLAAKRQAKAQALQGIAESMQEIRQGQELQTLTDFLYECRD